MDYKTHLLEGRFLRRYKRFFADVELSVGGRRKTVTAHVANTGSLKGVCDEISPCRVAFHDDPNRKLKYSLEHVQRGSAWVGVNTRLANDLVAEAFELKQLKHWAHLVGVHREFKLNEKSRLDFRFTDKKGRFHFVEVKSVSMAVPAGNALIAQFPDAPLVAQFPDAPTVRGQKHLEDLMALVKKGHSAEIFFVVQRTDAHSFEPARLIDPKYAELLLKAQRAGVGVSAYAVELSAQAAAIRAEPLRIEV